MRTTTVRPPTTAAQQAGAVLAPVRAIVAMVLTTLCAAELRTGLAGPPRVPLVVLGVAAVLAVVLRGVVAPALRGDRARATARGGAGAVLDAGVVLAVIALLPRHGGTLWALMTLPLVEAGMLAGLAGTLGAWALTAPVLVTIARPVSTGTPGPGGAVPWQQVAEPICVLLLLAIPVGLLARTLAVQTAATRAEHRRAAVHVRRLSTLADRASGLVQRDQPGVERAALGAARALGAVAVSAWRAAPDGGWTPAGSLGPAHHAPGRTSAQRSRAAGAPGSAPGPFARQMAQRAAAATPGATEVTALDGHARLRVRPGAQQPDLLLLLDFPAHLPLDEDLLAAVTLLGRHTAVALDGAATVENLTAAQRELTDRTLRDALTGLPNRVALTAALEEHHRGEAPSGCTSLLFLDLDGFKAVNDTLGHRVGDLVLIEVAERLGRAMRPGDLLARLGGDEFCALLRQHDGEAGVRDDAQRLIDVLEAHLFHGLPVSASIGIAPLAPGWDPGSVVAAADEAMYAAKKAGGRRWAAADRAPARIG